jgi:RNase P/RNase MRP subunit POP5
MIRRKCKEHFEKNPFEINLKMIKFKDNYGIIRCKHTEKENVINLLRSIENINDKSIKIETIATSGTIKALIRKHMKKIFIEK